MSQCVARLSLGIMVVSFELEILWYTLYPFGSPFHSRSDNGCNVINPDQFILNQQIQASILVVIIAGIVYYMIYNGLHVKKFKSSIAVYMFVLHDYILCGVPEGEARILRPTSFVTYG